VAKIIIISYWYYPSMGAAPDRIKNIVDFFISEGHKVTLLTEEGNPISNNNLSIIQLKFKGRKLLDTIKFTNPALIIYSIPPSFGIINLDKIVKKYNFILDIRDPLYLNYRTKNILKKCGLRHYEKRLIKKAKLVVINSPGIEKIYRKEGIKRSFYLLPNGYREELFSDIRDWTGKFLFFGVFNRNYSIKNFQNFFKLYSNDIKKKGYTYDFYSFTNSPELRQARLFSKENSYDFIHFLEPISEDLFKEKLRNYNIGITYVKTPYSIASKLYTYLSLGIPTMNVTNKNITFSGIISDYNLGLSINPERYDPELFDELEKNYNKLCKDVLKERVIFKWNNLIEDFYQKELIRWLR